MGRQACRPAADLCLQAPVSSRESKSFAAKASRALSRGWNASTVCAIASMTGHPMSVITCGHMALHQSGCRSGTCICCTTLNSREVGAHLPILLQCSHAAVHPPQADYEWRTGFRPVWHDIFEWRCHGYNQALLLWQDRHRCRLRLITM